MARVFLGLGSNLGDRDAALQDAADYLVGRGVAITRRSSRYLTEPVGGPPQDWFTNAVLEAETALTPEDLLAGCLDAELARGRVRREKNGPRTLDVDVLFYDDLVRIAPDPVLPHPRLHERRFVLVPLAEIAPDFVHPRLHRTVLDLLAHCPDRSVVRLAAPQGVRA
jgi:2-amino-4-hydroxy-6-hydroxymethyldihydropteridine diphosphokinase